MNWFWWVGYIAAAIGLRWLTTHFMPNADAYLVGGAISIWLLLQIYRRTRLYGLQDLYLRASDAERARLFGPMSRASSEARPTDELLSVTPDETVRVVFTYPRGSLVLTTVYFWVTALFAAGLLMPLVRGRVHDPGNAWVLFILAALFVLVARTHRRVLLWLGTQLIVDSDGLTLIRRGGKPLTLQWKGIKGVRRRRWARALEFVGPDGYSIPVWPTLVGYARFVSLAVGHLQRARAGAA